MAVVESTIEGRYQVITRIASGGMGEVYRAHDAVLARDVAVKILHPHLAGDRGFVDRFRREARAAAILNHPNIVGVYDWGSTDGTYFMVMEFVHGTNLRTVLAEVDRLEPAQVVEVDLQVLSALDHAHGHGIVHRDVKPENILIASDGTVKVADFGLARAYADSYVSQAEGTVTGTVQYLAPEQIQGQPADPRTDLYALGVVTFELLTGRLPFTGETSLAIAYQHLSNRVPPPSSLVPSVPVALDRATVHATQRERDQRPASARALRDEIARAGVGLPPAPRLAEVAAQIPALDVPEEDRAPTVTIPRSISPRAKRARRVRFVFTMLLLALVMGIGIGAAWVYLVPHYTHVPNVVGLPEDQAAAKLKAAGLVVTVGQGQHSTIVDNNSIIATIPKWGTRLRKGKTVTLIPSLGPRQILPVDVSGLTEQDATQKLRAQGFVVTVRRAHDDVVKLGTVISQDPVPDQKIPEGSTVTIVVSLGPPPVKIPDLTDTPEQDAIARLKDLGFVVKEIQDFSPSVAKGNVISTDPPGGRTAPKGSTVTIDVSKGPQTFPMPDVYGLSREAAVAELGALGLRVQVTVIPGTSGDQVVLQSPNAQQTVHQGDTVFIWVTAP